METRIETFGVPGMVTRLDRMRLQATIVEATAFPLVVADFHRIQTQQFDTGGPRGSRWAPLSPATVERKDDAGHGSKDTLVATGALRDSLTSSESPGSVVRMMPQYLEMGTNLPHAHFHQEGTSRAPRRTLIDINRDDVMRWGAILQRTLIPTVIGGGMPDEGIVG